MQETTVTIQCRSHFGTGMRCMHALVGHAGVHSNKMDRPPFYLWLGQRETALELQKCVLQVQTSEKAKISSERSCS